MLPTSFMFSEICNKKLSFVKVWFANQNSNPLKTEDRL